MKKYDYTELLYTLDSIMADYGGNTLQFPEHLQNKSLEDLTEEEAQEVFEYNGGNEEEVSSYGE
jgi:hypothetical protein